MPLLCFAKQGHFLLAFVGLRPTKARISENGLSLILVDQKGIFSENPRF
jgi:hypothetical protein